MQRYNIFLQVHKGLRAMLYQTAAALQQANFTDPEETDQILDQVLELVELFDIHAASEDNFILPAIKEKDPDSVTLFERGHKEDQQLSSRIRVLLNIFYYTSSDDEKNVLGSAIRFASVEFLVSNLKHMAKEEDIANNLLWKYYTDEELGVITQKIIAHIPRNTLDRYSRWMMVGLNNTEIINWLNAVRNSAPQFIFGGLLSLAEKELPGQRWQAIKGALFEGAMVA